MKEMDSLSVGPKKSEELREGAQSFLLVDEQENLQVKLAELMLTASCLAKAKLTLPLMEAHASRCT